MLEMLRLYHNRIQELMLNIIVLRFSAENMHLSVLILYISSRNETT
jgi:hypothetical protein